MGGERAGLKCTAPEWEVGGGGGRTQGMAGGWYLGEFRVRVPYTCIACCYLAPLHVTAPPAQSAFKP